MDNSTTLHTDQLLNHYSIFLLDDMCTWTIHTLTKSSGVHIHDVLTSSETSPNTFSVSNMKALA